MARRVLGRALRRAEQEGWILRNAAHLADGPRMDDDEEDCEDDDEDDSPVFTVEQARAVLKAAMSHRYGGPMAVQLSLGLRRGEALGLSRKNLFLDDEPSCIRVRQQLIRLKGKGLVIRKVKTKKSRRTLIVPPQVQEVILDADVQQQRHIERSGEHWSLTHGPLVFTTPIGTPIDPDNYRHQVSTLAKSVGIGHIGTHTLRRSAGSFLYAMACR